VPFLDHQFVEFAMQIPDSLKIRGSTQKYVLKKAVEDLLPHEIIYRKKMGFPTPLRQWLLEAQSEPMLAALEDRDNWMASYINMGAVSRLIERHRSGEIDATDRIWRLLNLQIWGDVFFTEKTDRWRSREAAPTAV
jgi:asparagine synthase (glutamine-hydrolysing)